MNWVTQQVVDLSPKAPVLEVGSRDINGTIRDLFPQEDYLGIDLEAGPGTDLVLDIINDDISELENRFNTVVATETLEHMTQPWVGVESMHKALKRGGLIILTWVFACQIHNEPDYWRGTPSAMHFLLENVGFADIHVEKEGGTDRSPVGIFATARRR